MRSPKILSWVANRNGVAIERAEELWRQAVVQGDLHYGSPETRPEYWGYVVDAFLKLVRCEGRAIETRSTMPGVPLESPATYWLAYHGLLASIAINTSIATVRAATEVLKRVTTRA